MKHSIKGIIVLATLAVLLITAYQAYWLGDIYVTLQNDLQRDINEAMRSSDFEEIANRVNILKQQGHGGSMAVSVGSDNPHEQVEVKNEYKSEHEDSAAEMQEEEVNSTVPYDNFSDALKDEEAVRRVGLYMQRGIHDGLDAIMPLNPEFYDSLLCARLDSLGVSRKHSTLYLGKVNGGFDTLKVIGARNITEADTFRLSLNSLDDKQYVLLLEKRFFTIPQKMHSALLFSFFTLVVLILAFWYTVNTIRRMRALDEMKSDFTNNITHELKTPIAVAYAANDALLNFGADNPEKTRKYLTICQEQLSLLTQLVEQILSLSMERRKTMKLEMESIPLAPVIDKLMENQKLKIKKQLTVDCDVPKTVNVFADRIHLNNIINNLIDNAVKYSGNNLHLVIKAIRQLDGKVVLTVSDNGIGISADQQRYIFDKFYRVPHGNLHKIKGYGLGLYYVKTMMEKLGGSVSLKSEEGKGTTFKLIFNGEN